MNVEQKRIELDRTKGQLDRLAWLLDNYFKFPGTNWRFGLDALVGLIPGAGDLGSGAIGFLLLFRAFQFRLPKVVIMRMIFNSLIDITVGAIPLIGDAFDFLWKSNSMNMKLFHEYAGEPEKSTRRHWIFILILFGSFFAVFGLILAGIIYCFYRIFYR